MTTAYSYVRMSTPEQLKGDSLRRQLEFSRRFADEHGLVLDDTLRDIGVSAFHGNNRDKGALATFLRMVSTGGIVPGSYLLVESLDRLSRDQVFEALELFLSIIRSGITIATLADGQIYNRETIGNDFTKLIISLVVMSRAHEESAQKSKRLSAAWESKRARMSERKLTARCPAWLRLVDGGRRFEVIEHRALIVRRIFEETANGVGKYKIAERLNRDGVGNFGRGDGWHASYVQKLLEREAVLGVYQPHKKVRGHREPIGDPDRTYFPPIIDEDLFWRARKAKEARRNGEAGLKGRHLYNILSGLCRCCACGKTMVYRDKGDRPKGGQYLVCSNALRGNGCTSRKHYPYANAEAAVLGHVSEFDFSAIVEQRPQEIVKSETALARLDDEVAKAKRRQAALIDAFEDSADPAIVAKIKSLGEEIAAKQKEQAALRRKVRATRMAQTPEGYAEEIEQLKARLADAKGDDLFLLRAAIAEGLKEIIEVVMLAPDLDLIDVALLGFSKIYRVQFGRLASVLDFGTLGDQRERMRSLTEVRGGSRQDPEFERRVAELVARFARVPDHIELIAGQVLRRGELSK